MQSKSTKSSEYITSELETTRLELRNLEAAVKELNRIKNELKESEMRYRAAFEYTGTAMIVIDNDMTIIMANHKLEEFTGYSQDEILKRHKWTEFVVPEDIERMKEYHKKRRIDPQSVPNEYEFRLIHRDGTIRDMFINVALIPGTDKSLVSLVDISPLKDSERALRESQQRFKETVDLLPGIICEIDLSMKLTYVNEMGLASFGFTHEDFERGISVLDLVPEDEYDRFSQDFYNVTHGDFGNPKLYELYNKDRSRMQLIVNSAPIIKNNTVVGIRSCVTDISDRVRAERQLRESEERFRSIYDSSPIGIALYHIDGKLLDHNVAFACMFGGLQSGAFPRDLFTSIELDPQLRAKLGEGTPITIESAVSGVDGKKEKRWFEWHLSSIGMPAQAPSMYLAQVQDITARKEAQEARLQKEREATARAEALVAGLRRELREYTCFNSIVSRSSEMKKIFDILPEVAQATATVLIIGETGTGKELIARSLHDLSSHKDKPFIAVNCSALPDNLLESELFGYKAGAFTDAKKDKPGRFALAEGGTIFLDEIGDISVAMQVKLLRVLQEKVYEPLGAIQPVKANVRVIAATNKNLAEMVDRCVFREDLYYRINVISIRLPSLRERMCDIPLLCNHFIERFNTRYNKNIRTLSEEALQLLMVHEFPGNIRELENIIEHAFIFCKGTTIEIQHLPAPFRERNGASDTAVFARIKSFDELERIYIKSVLTECGGNKLAAAERLGIHKATLFRKIKQLGIQ